MIDNTQIQPVLNDTPMLIGFISGSVIVFALAILALVYSYRKIQNHLTNTATDNTSRNPNTYRTIWRQRIEQIVKQYHQHNLSYDESCTQLAAVAREYVSVLAGDNIQSHTLGELSSLRHTWSNTRGADMIRQTIAALYPTEFADPQSNQQAQETSVDQAAQWVLVLLESWPSSHKHGKDR